MPPSNNSHVHDFIVEGLWAKRGIHLVSGPSGAGKTTWILPTMVDWAAGNPLCFNGNYFISHPEPWVYISGDRSAEVARRKIDELGLTGKVPLLAAYATGREMDWERVLNLALEQKYKVLVWEGFGRYVKGDKASVLDRWLEQVTYQAISFDLTIIGIVEQPKMKPKDRYIIPRQRISGPAGWGHAAGTIILIEYANDKDPSDPSRKMFVIPHEATAPIEVNATIAGGVFQILP
jgi:hypothetical protein